MFLSVIMTIIISLPMVPQIDRHATPSVCAWQHASPVGHAAAAWAEVERDALLATNVGRGHPGRADAFTLKVVGPQHAVAATHGAVAGSD